MTDYERELRHFIESTFIAGASGAPLAADESLLERGAIDSTGVLQLVGFLEERYGITVDDDEFVPENLDSLDRLVRFLERKRGQQIADAPRLSSEPAASPRTT